MDGDTIATRAFEGDDEKVGVYSISSGTAVRALEGHSEPVSALSMDAGRLASASADGTARLWDLSSGECLAKTHSSGEALRGVSLRGNFLATGCAANRASLFQLGEGKSDDGRTWKGYRRSEFDDRGEGEGGGHEGGEDRGGIVEVLLPRVGEMRHDGSVYCVVVTAGGRVASLGWNSTDLKLWGLDGAQLEVALPSASGFAMVLDSSDAIIFLGLRSGHVACYSMEDGLMHGIFAANAARREVSALALCGELHRGVTLVCACEHAPQAIRIMGLPPKVAGDMAWKAKPELLCTHGARRSPLPAVRPSAALLLCTPFALSSSPVAIAHARLRLILAPPLLPPPPTLLLTPPPPLLSVRHADALHGVVGVALHSTLGLLVSAGPEDELEVWRPKDPSYVQPDPKAAAKKMLKTLPSTQLPIDLSDPSIRALCQDPRLTTHSEGRITDASLCVPDAY